MVKRRATIKVELGSFGSDYGDSLNLSVEISNDGSWSVVAYGSPSDLRRAGTLVRLDFEALSGLQKALDQVSEITMQHGAQNPWQRGNVNRAQVAPLELETRSGSTKSVVDDLERLAALVKEGCLSAEEFNLLKTRYF